MLIPFILDIFNIMFMRFVHNILPLCCCDCWVGSRGKACTKNYSWAWIHCKNLHHHDHSGICCFMLSAIQKIYFFFEGHKVERSHYERLKLAKLKFNCACKYSATLISYHLNLLFIWKWWILLSSSSFNLYLQQIVNKLKHDENHMREITE